MRIAVKYVLPLMMVIALSSFSFPARAANDDLLNATLGQAIGQFMSQTQQSGKAAPNAVRPANRGRLFHAKKSKGQTPAVPVLAAPATPVAPATPAVPASASAPAANPAFTRPMNAFPAIAPAAGAPAVVPSATTVTHTQKTLPSSSNVSIPAGENLTGGTPR